MFGGAIPPELLHGIATSMCFVYGFVSGINTH